jgi:hypothetical protein
MCPALFCFGLDTAKNAPTRPAKTYSTNDLHKEKYDGNVEED